MPSSPNKRAENLRSRNKVSSEDPCSWMFIALRVACFLCFAGWGWEHIRWDVPYREILWNGNTMAPVLSLLDITYDEFVSDPKIRHIIATGIECVGYIYLGLAVLCLTVKKHSRIQIVLLLAGSISLAFVAYLQYLGNKHVIGQFIEYSCQVVSPLILVMALKYGLRRRGLIIMAKIAVALTFIGHGLYAVGYYEVPPQFMAMCTTILSLSHEQAQVFLLVAGILDFALAIGIFIQRFSKISLIWAVLWGTATTFSRVVYGMMGTYAHWGLEQYLHETLLRAPHIIIPLYLLMIGGGVFTFKYVRKTKQDTEPDSQSIRAATCAES